LFAQIFLSRSNFDMKSAFLCLPSAFDSIRVVYDKNAPVDAALNEPDDEGGTRTWESKDKEQNGGSE